MLAPTVLDDDWRHQGHLIYAMHIGKRQELLYTFLLHCAVLFIIYPFLLTIAAAELVDVETSDG